MLELEQLEMKLKSADSEERREAVVELGCAGAVAVPLLFRALGDADWRVRKTAVGALVRFNGANVIAELIETLASHDNAGARNAAIEALVHIGSGALDALLPMLGTTDADVRKFIIDILGDIRDAGAVPALIAVLDDPDENIRVAAAEALGKIRDSRAVDALVACLRRTDRGWLDYAAAAEALGQIGDERALGPLMNALDRITLREPVLEALGRIGNEKTLAPLVCGLADPLRIVREVSMGALLAIHRKSAPPAQQTIAQTVRREIAEKAVERAEEMLGSSAGEHRNAAIAVLGWAGRERSIDKLLALLNEEELEAPMVQALTAMGAGAAPVLLGYAGSENALIRRTVAQVLGLFGKPEAEEPLIRMLGDENGHVRSMAAEALGRLKSRRALQPLVELLIDEYQSVQESAIQALAAIGDESVLGGLIKDFSLHDTSLRRNIVLLLGKFSTADAGEALIFALKDEEPDVRKAVVHALGNQPGERALRPLMLAVTDDDPEVRMLAAEALGRISAPGVSEALISLLEDDDLWVRAAAARGLGAIGGTKAGELLASYLDKANDIFLLALVEIVGRLRVGQARDTLLNLVEHDDPEVRKIVLAALAGYPWGAVQRAVTSRLSDPHWSVRKAAIEIAGQHRDASVDSLLEVIATHDADATVREAAKRVLGR